MERLNLSDPYNPVEASIHSCRYWFARQIPDEGRLLDAGCGFGYGCKLIRRVRSEVEIIGIDKDTNAIQFASAELCISKSLFKVFDLDQQSILDELGLFDTIISIETLEHLRNPKALLEQFKQVWTGAGPIIISWPNDPLYYGFGQSLNRFHLESLSWIGIRNVAEDVLGGADWF